MKEMKSDIRKLLLQQTELELNDMSMTERILKDCDKSKQCG